MANLEPKKTTTIYSRVPDTFKDRFKRALGTLRISEAYFVREAAEALVALVESKEDLALPVRLLTVAQKNALSKKKLQAKRS